MQCVDRHTLEVANLSSLLKVRMTARLFGAVSKLGVVRSMVLLVVGIALVVLMLGAVVDQNNNLICESKQNDPSDIEGVLRHSDQRTKNWSIDEMPLVPWNYNWDLKANQYSQSEANSIPDRHLILVRHGQYFFTTGKLTQLGREQADLTGRRLKEMNLTYKAIVHSTLERADETAQLIHSHIPRVPLGMDDMLREGGPIPPNPTVSYWGLPERDYYIDGPRLESAFRKYVYRPGKEQRSQTFEILVGHGNIFRFFALRALQLQKDAWMRVFIGHASMTMLHMRADGTVSMTKFGDTGHIPSNQVTY